MKMRLADLSTKFSNHVLDATKAFSVTIDDPSKVEGVPDSGKAMWANAHIQHLKSQAKEGEEVPEMNAETGHWRITLDMPS
jgi:oligopeptidase A